jgi:nucleosome binding factor SPN SPT16 subunit
MSVTIDIENFERKFKLVQQYLTKGNFEALSIALGPTDENINESEASGFFHWFLGYEFPDSVIIITKDCVAFLSSKKKIQILQQLSQSSVRTDFVTRVKEDETIGLTRFYEPNLSVRRLALISRSTGSDFANDWVKFVEEKVPLVEKVTDVTSLWTVKEKTELDYILYASQLCEVIFNDVIAVALREYFSITSSTLRRQVLDVLEKKSHGIASILPRQESVEYFEIFDVKIIQSVDLYCVDITCKYKSYMSSFSRVFLQSSTENVSKFNALNDARAHLIPLLKSGASSLSIHNDMKKYLKTLDQSGIVYNIASFGHSVLHYTYI